MLSPDRSQGSNTEQAMLSLNLLIYVFVYIRNAITVTAEFEVTVPQAKLRTMQPGLCIL